MSYREELIQVAAVAVAALTNLHSGTTADMDMSREHLKEIETERLRQEAKWGPQNHSPEKWFTILGEEVGEVANAILEQEIV